MRKILLLLLICLLGGVTSDAARPRKSSRPASQTRTAETVRSERQRTEKEIAETRKKIKQTQKQTREKLEHLEGINAGIRMQETRIVNLNTRLDSLSGAISAVSDTIGVIEGQVNTLRADLKSTLRSMRRRRKSGNDVAFVFSAPTFDAAQRRISYLDQLNRWRTRKVKALRDKMQQLTDKQTELKGLETSQASALSQLNASKQTLVQQQQQQKKAVDDLRGQTANLNKILSEKQKRMRQLDSELDRIIAAEEQRRRKAEEQQRKKDKDQGKPATGPKTDTQDGYAEAERALSGSFEANRGRLLFPVAGRYTVIGTFGRTGHAGLSGVEVNNSGIDIAVSPGTNARAVFGGTVSSVFFVNGYDNVVMVRHGRYITVYAGLSSLAVHKGTVVKPGTVLGTVLTDADNPQRAVLHFEVRNEKQKLNPLEWVH